MCGARSWKTTRTRLPMATFTFAKQQYSQPGTYRLTSTATANGVTGQATTTFIWQ